LPITIQKRLSIINAIPVLKAGNLPVKKCTRNNDSEAILINIPVRLTLFILASGELKYTNPNTMQFISNIKNVTYLIVLDFSFGSRIE